MNTGIEVLHVCKKYKDNVVLKDVNAEFEPGKIHGVFGRNGSGKTVFFRCICGFTPLSGGEIRINSEPISCYSAKNIGVILEEPGFLNAYSAYDNLRFLAGLTGKKTEKQVRSTLISVGLDPYSKKRVGQYSLGMRHRLAIAQAVIDSPPVLILDEPMNGLDRDGVRDISTMLRELVELEGTTILLSSHYLEDMKFLCDDLWEMEDGKLASIG